MEEEDDESRDAEAKDETPDASNPKSLARVKQKKEFKDNQVSDFWKRTLADPIGRMVLWDLLRSMHTFEDRFACAPSGAPCTEATWFQAGEKEIGQRLFKTLMKHDIAATHLMLTEHDPEFKPPKTKRKDSNG